MPADNSLPSSSTIIVRAGLLFSLTMLFTALLFVSSRRSSPHTVEGFDFTPVLKMKPEGGPDIGERIDLTRLVSREGISLASTVTKGRAMIALLNPRCALCRTAAGTMRDIKERIKQYDVEYYIVSFNSSEPASVFKYCDSLGLDAPVFVWSSKQGIPPELLSAMVTPSHILINDKGTIIDKWPGSNEDKALRERMANQIILDTEAGGNYIEHRPTQ